jgi:hypothetical protein
VETDPYPAYVARIEQANAIFIAAVQQAVNERDSAWQTALANAQVEADAAYQRYLAELSSAREQYNSAVEQAQQAFQRAIAEAESQRDAAIAFAEATLEYYIGPYEVEYENAVAAAQSRYQESIAQADQEYFDYIAPYLQARDSAYQYWQEHPDDLDAWQAYQDAEQQYQDALLVAESMRQTAYEAAQAQLEEELVAADDRFANAIEPHYNNYNAAVEDAWRNWQTRVDQALWQRDRALEQADELYFASESAAWGGYLTKLQEINSALSDQFARIQDGFATALSEAAHVWMQGEAQAWETYTLQRESMLQPPPLGSRYEVPPNVPWQNLCLCQLQENEEKKGVRAHPTAKELDLQKLLSKWREHTTANLARLGAPAPPQVDPVEQGNLIRWVNWIKDLGPKGGAAVLDGALLLGLRRANAWLAKGAELSVSGHFSEDGRTYFIDDVKPVALGRLEGEITIPKPILRRPAAILKFTIFQTTLKAKLDIDIVEKNFGPNRQWMTGKLVYTLRLEGPFTKQVVQATQTFRIDVTYDDKGAYLTFDIHDDYQFSRKEPNR